MDVFEFTNYRRLIRVRIELFPQKGYGQLSRLAKHLGVNPTLISQILSGTKDLSEDQAYAVSEFFGFNDRETFYFVMLVQRERAGDHRLKKLFDKQIRTYQQEAQSMKNRIVPEKELSFESQAVFYSNWLYTAIHTLSSVERFQSVDAIAEHLGISRPMVKQIVDWLLEQGLCKEEKGSLKVGPSTTFIGADSPLVTRHHANWRQKALEVMSDYKPEHFFFTAPFSLSEEDFAEIRKELVQLIDRVAKRVEKSDPAVMANINIDYFKV